MAEETITAPVAPATPEPAAAPEPASEPVKEQPNGTEGQESPETSTEGTEPAKPAGEAKEEPAASTESFGDELFEGVVAVPKDTLGKLREALGDEGAFDVVSKLDSVEQLAQEFGTVPTVEEIRQLGQSNLALVDLYKNLESNPQEAVNFFLLNDQGGLDEMGAKFVGALADGVQRGTVPKEVRAAFAKSITSALIVDVQQRRRDYQVEAKYAEENGLEAKAKEMKLKDFELQLFEEFLAPYAKLKLDPIERPAQTPAPKQPEQPQGPDPAIAQFQQDQKAYNSQKLGEIVTGYVSKLPNTLPPSVKTSTAYAIEQQVLENIRSGKNPLIRLANGNFENGYRLWEAGDVAGAQASFDRAYKLFENGAKQVAAQIATPILNDLNVSVATKSQAQAAAKQAGQEKSPVLDTAAAGAPGGATNPTDSLKRLPNEKPDDYLKRIGPLLQMGKR